MYPNIYKEKTVMNIYKENEKHTLGYYDINTREELQAIADEENIDINWDLWDKLVKQTRKDITNNLKHHKKPLYTNGRPRKTVYVYNLRGTLKKTFDDTKECAAYYKIRLEQLNLYMRNEQPYYKLELFFTSTPLNI